MCGPGPGTKSVSKPAELTRASLVGASLPPLICWVLAASSAAVPAAASGCGGGPPMRGQAPHAAPDPWIKDRASHVLEAAARASAASWFDGNARLLRSGDRLVFESSRDGQSQLYEASLGATEVRRLLTWSSATSLIDVTADERAVLFAADQNGDEHARFYRVERESGLVTCLTPDTLQRDTPIVPGRRPELLIFSARDRGDGRTSVLEVSTERARPARTLYRDPGAGFLLDVSPDGALGLFSRFGTHQEQELLLLDFATGAATSLYPRRGEATIGAAAFAGDRVLVMTDGGGESSLVLALDRAGSEVARFVEQAPRTAVGERLVVAGDGETVAAGFDAGTHHFVRLLDARTLTERVRSSLPLGSGSADAFSPDGRTLLLTWSTPDAPWAPLAMDVRSGAVSSLRADQRGRATPMVVEQLRLPSADGVEVPVNVFRPRGSAPAPVIVHLHGGPAGSSAIRWSAMIQFFVARGYAWVDPNIRGSGGFGRQFEAADDGPRRVTSFADVAAVQAWVAKRPWADATRLVVMGESFGGWLVLSELTRRPRAWRAGVDAFGIADFPTFMASTAGLVRENYLHELGDPVADRALLDRLSPLREASRIEAPLFVYAGANDPRVPRSQSDLIVRELRRRGRRVEYMLASEEGHGFANQETLVEYQVRVARFLESALELRGDRR